MRKHVREWLGFILYLERSVDAADQCIQNIDSLMLVEQDEGEQSLQQGRFSHAPQEEVEVGRSGHHLL